MPWTNSSEKDMLYEWAIKNYTKERSEDIFPKADSGVASYWIPYREDEEIMEYDFETLPEFLVMAKRYLNSSYMEEILKPVAVAVMKNQPITKNQNTTNKKIVSDEEILEIPEYRYVF